MKYINDNKIIKIMKNKQMKQLLIVKMKMKMK